jgi:hypothetical protein
MKKSLFGVSGKDFGQAKLDTVLENFSKTSEFG